MSEQLLETPSTHSFSIAGLADAAWNRIREIAFRTGWGPATRWAEAAVVALMQNITNGQLRVLTTSHIYIFPTPSESGDVKPDLTAVLRVINDTFWIRLCTMGDLGFAEAYMYGDVECDDLVSLFKIFMENKDNLAAMDSVVSYLFTFPQKLTSYRFLNTIGNARANISAHYDISNDMFLGFLSEDMTYSCAIFEDLDGDLDHDSTIQQVCNGGEGPQRHQNGSPAKIGQIFSSPAWHDNSRDLHFAQLRKLRHIIEKARILPGQRVLEIGSGWGSMAILIAQTVPDSTIDTITLSVEQRSLARKRIDAAGLGQRITVHLMDYRNMPEEWEGVFDRVISIEMIEAVGLEFLNKYWGVVDWAMKKNEGVGVVQVITIPEARFERYSREVDFILFPGGILPTLTLLLQTLQNGSSGRLVVDSVCNIGPHYARTLREWRRRFLENFESVIVPALKREYPTVMGGVRGREESELFKRKWLYYYCYCEVGFTTRTLGDHIITFTREGYQAYGCNVCQQRRH